MAKKADVKNLEIMGIDLVEVPITIVGTTLNVIYGVDEVSVI